MEFTIHFDNMSTLLLSRGFQRIPLATKAMQIEPITVASNSVLSIKHRTLLHISTLHQEILCISVTNVTMRSWLDELKEAKKSAIVDHNLKKVLYELKDGRHLVEEYDLQSETVTRRAWKVKDKIGNHKEWDIELGDPEPSLEDFSKISIRENSTQPFVSRRNTKKHLEWRIRNLPYPIEIYSITCDEEKRNIIVRTQNKKYFKTLTVPELERLGMVPKQDNVFFVHKCNTLIITYKKPKELLEFEKSVLEIVKKIETKPQKFDQNSCKPS